MSTRPSSPSRPHSSKNPAALKPSRRASQTAVLHLCPDLEPGDPAREAVELAVLTQRSGWRSLITSGGGPLVTEAERAAVRHTRMPLDRRGIFTSWRNRVHLEALFQRERPALIHAHGFEVLPRAYSLARTHRLPLVVDLTQPLPDQPRIHRLLANLGRVQCLLRVPSDYMLNQLQDVFQVIPDYIRPVAPGVDLHWHNSAAISTERMQNLTRLWRLPEQATVILVPMPLCEGFGHSIFLQALASMKSENLFAVLIGTDRQSPGLRAELENQVNQLGLNGKIVMPEFCMDWPTAFWLASVVVAPNSLPRGQARELLAAQAVGRPVIVTDTGANSEMVRSGETAWVIPPDNVQALADALREAIHLDTEQRLGLAEHTRDFIAGTFPQDVWFQGIMEIYQSLLRLPAQVKAKAA
ncbi:MAG: glycosyltransferase [Alphaproteobacteria bacterium]|nr:glycosyltransferase [Alphaproteobacteria bacterium]